MTVSDVIEINPRETIDAADVANAGVVLVGEAGVGELDAKTWKAIRGRVENRPTLVVLIDAGHRARPLLDQALRRLSAGADAWERTIQSVLPDDPTLLSGAEAAQAHSNAEARSAFVRDVPMLTSREVAATAHSRSKNPAALAHAWRRNGRIFGVPWGHQLLVPAFQLGRDGRPLPVVADVLAPLHEAGLDGWEIALWFVGKNGWLNGDRPIDRLVDADAVVSAAERVGSFPF